MKGAIIMLIKRMICLFCTSLLIMGCANDGENPTLPSFVDLTAFQQFDEGWVAYLYIETMKKDPEKIETIENVDLNQIQSVFFDIVNLKYSKLEDFYIPVKDQNGELLYQATTVQPSYVQSIYGEEMKKINQYLSSKKFQHPITIQDLETCESSLFTTGVIKKEDLVKLYNDALNHDQEFHHHFIHVRETDTLSLELENKSRIQFSYIKNFSDIGICELEYIDQEGNYLSDLVAHQQANEQQINLQKTFDEIETTLTTTQQMNDLPLTENKALDLAVSQLLKEALEQ